MNKFDIFQLSPIKTRVDGYFLSTTLQLTLVQNKGKLKTKNKNLLPAAVGQSYKALFLLDKQGMPLLVTRQRHRTGMVREHVSQIKGVHKLSHQITLEK
jgi:hypothetical protein